MFAGSALDAADAVVAKRQVEHRIVGRAADVGTRVGGQQLHGQHPPPGRDDDRDHATEQVKQSVPPARRRQQEVGQREARQHQECLEHLGQKRGPNHQPNQQQPAP
jgi:hypothetical protein